MALDAAVLCRIAASCDGVAFALSQVCRDTAFLAAAIKGDAGLLESALGMPLQAALQDAIDAGNADKAAVLLEMGSSRSIAVPPRALATAAGLGAARLVDVLMRHVGTSRAAGMDFKEALLVSALRGLSDVAASLLRAKPAFSMDEYEIQALSARIFATPQSTAHFRQKLVPSLDENMNRCGSAYVISLAQGHTETARIIREHGVAIEEGDVMMAVAWLGGSALVAKESRQAIALNVIAHFRSLGHMPHFGDFLGGSQNVLF